MKQSFHYIAVLLFVVLLVCSSKLSAVRVSATQKGEKEVMSLGEITGEDSLVRMEDRESMELMGMETCDGGDEECIMRRMISEAHLDYIYTQHHKP